MTQLFAQHGYSLGNKISDALTLKVINGVIFGPRDILPEQITSRIVEYRKISNSVECMIDPQYYAYSLANKSDARLGNLIGYPYFSAKRRSDLEREGFVKQEIKTCLDFQKEFDLNFLVAPNILISRSFNSIEGVIAKHFFRQVGELKNDYDKPVYASLVISRDALLEKEELDIFLEEVTSCDAYPDGVYLLVAAQSSEARLDIYNADVIAGCLLINHAFKVSSIDVINGYSDILTPLLGCVGAKAGATGWWSNLRTFSLDRFQPNDGGGRQPNQRYLSAQLLNRLNYVEFHRLRGGFPGIVNGLPSDQYYPLQNGSEPERVKEVLQSWDALNRLCNQINSHDAGVNLGAFMGRVKKAKELYEKIEAETLMPLEEKSKGFHLDALEQAVTVFCQKAEIVIGN